MRRPILHAVRLNRLPALLAVALLAGCVSFPGSYPGSNRYPDDSYSRYPDTSAQASMQAEVFDVDHANRRFMVTPQQGYGSGTYPSYRRNEPVEFYYDSTASLYYRGQRMEVDGLEPGDGVRISYDDDGRTLWARTIEVTRNVRDGGYSSPSPSPSYPPPASSPGMDQYQLRGALTSVEPHNRVLRVRDGGGPEQWMRYDDRTTVDYRSQPYQPDQLQRGDVIRVQARQIGGVWHADAIWVERSISGN